jgi:hypothetical protein
LPAASTQITPVLAGDDLARGDGGEHQQKADVDRRRDDAAKLGRKQDRHTPAKPQQREAGQRPAAYRQTPGPVRNGREQKAGDGGGDIAVEHFVDVPVERAELGRQRKLTDILRQPEQDAEGRPQAGGEEERPEAVGEQRGAGIVAAAGQGGRHRHDGNLLAAL